MNIQWTVAWAIAKRNFLSYFLNPIAYLFIAGFSTATAFFAFANGDAFFANNLSELGGLSTAFPYLLMMFLPTITMGTWAEERRTGTEELLLTLPASDLSIVLGKYASVLAIYTVSLLFSLWNVVILSMVGGFDSGMMLTTYTGYWLMGAALLSAGMVASQLTSNTTVGYILGVLISAFLVSLHQADTRVENFFAMFHSATPNAVLITLAVLAALLVLVIAIQIVERRSTAILNGLAGGLVVLILLGLAVFFRTGERNAEAALSMAGGDDFFRQFVRAIGIVPQFSPFAEGLISLPAVFTFLAIIVVMLYLNVFLLGRRHWAGSEGAGLRSFHQLVRVAAVLVAAAGITMVASRASAYLFIDATSNKIHSLSADTYRVIAEVDEKRQVLIDAFISPRVPTEYVETRKNLIDLLRQYSAIGRSKVHVVIHDTENYSEEARRAEQVFGIRPMTVQISEAGQFRAEEIFLGVAFRSGLTEKTIPFVFRGTPVEYELTRMVQTVSATSRRKIGILATDAQMMGMGFMGGRWGIIDLLEQQYVVEQVAAGTTVPEEVDVLIAAMPSSLAQPQLDALIGYIRSGRPALILDDPLPGFNPRIAPHMPKSDPQQQMMFGQQMPGEPKCDLEPLFELINVRYEPSEVIRDLHNPMPENEGFTESIVFVDKNASGATREEQSFNPDHVVTRELKDFVVMRLPGGMRMRHAEGPSFTPLLQTSVQTSSAGAETVLNYFMALQEGSRRVRTPWNNLDRRMVVAAEIKGKPGSDLPKDPDEIQGEEKDIHVIFVADVDFTEDGIARLTQLGQQKLNFDNWNFVLNAVDYLAEDVSFLKLRSKRPERYTLRSLQKLTEAFQQQEQDLIANTRLETDVLIEKIQQEFSEKQRKARATAQSSQDLLQQTVLSLSQAERALEREREKLNREMDLKIRDIRMETRRKVEAEKDRIKLMALLPPSIPILLLGLGVYLVRLAREREGANPDRLV